MCHCRLREEPTRPRRLKMVVVGDGDCGKTRLFNRFTRDEFFTRFTPEAFQMEAKTVFYKEKQVELLIYDTATAGQEDSDCLPHFCFCDNPNVMVICFSVDNPHSLDNVLLHWLPLVHQFHGNVPVLLVANKKDLRRRSAHVTELLHSDLIEAFTGKSLKKLWMTKFPVTYEEGLSVATKMSAVGYFETSAKTGEGVDAVLEAVIRAGMEAKLKKRGRLFRMTKR